MSYLLEIHSLRKNTNDRGGECSNAVFEETAIYKSHVVELLIFPRLIMILNTYAVKASIFVCLHGVGPVCE